MVQFLIPVLPSFYIALQHRFRNERIRVAGMRNPHGFFHRLFTNEAGALFRRF
jgi:hypothetical protein